MSTSEWWNNRYQNGGNSGSGSYNELYIFKRDVINNIINENNVLSVIDFGCGDGNQIKELNINKYVGFDIAESSINICKKIYKDDTKKDFYTINTYDKILPKGELTMSLDVLYHILEEDIFINYLKKLFDSSTKYVLIYSNNYYGHIDKHMHTRKFSDYVDKYFPDWNLVKKIDQIYSSKSSADFYLYKKK